MRHIYIILYLITIGFSSQSCKNSDKKEIKKGYSIDKNRSEINWTAYKTTSKIPVSGKFTILNIKNNIEGKTVTEALDNVEFSIPVSSIFSNNKDRDYKLNKLFFGVMKDTELLSGIMHITDESNGYADFAMNSVIEKLPFTYSVVGEKIEIKAVMNTDSWQAQSAIESINNACLELHKGSDGISKTWSDVAIAISVYFK
ncbi:MAG: YceI family protein [Flavicella sp.]